MPRIGTDAIFAEAAGRSTHRGQAVIDRSTPTRTASLAHLPKSRPRETDGSSPSPSVDPG
jgi:hypothetical protein